MGILALPSVCPSLETPGKMPLWIREAICLKDSQPHIEIHTKVPLASDISDFNTLLLLHVKTLPLSTKWDVTPFAPLSLSF